MFNLFFVLSILLVTFISINEKNTIMARKSNHVVPSRTLGWSVKKSGASRASRNFSTKDEAIQYGRQLSKVEKTELYIHKMNGIIQNKSSYGNDPYPLKDKKL
jgi:Uncharacterized protein conserved in bacteria (DUF2188).